VISIVPDGPAGKAGIIDKDELISFNGKPVPVTATLRWINTFLEDNGERPITVVLRRDDEDKTFTVTPETGCGIPVQLETNPDPNAFTDYTKIVIQTGILRLTRTESDLAVIVGHELAHSTMGHHGKKRINSLLGTVGGGVIDGGFLLGGISTGGAFSNYLHIAGLNAFSVGFELEADYVGAYYAARAAMTSQVQKNFGSGIRLKFRRPFARRPRTRPHRYVTFSCARRLRKSPRRSEPINR
jgi:hypothetical protein